MRVLLVEDDKAFSDSLQLYLRSEGFNVYATDLGDEGLDLGKLFDYDVIILDLCLPDISGLDVVRGLRLAKIETPVLMLSGNSEIDNKISCLDAGADDYIVKSCDVNELVARVRAVARRVHGQVQNIISVGNINVDISSKAITVQDVSVSLSQKEYKLLELLFLRKGKVVSKDVIMDHLYGGMDEPDEKVIDVFVCRLRRKLARENNGDHYIKTVWGGGYSVSEPASENVTVVVTPEEIASLYSSGG
tara:strand:- start:345679 stop:346419 length:741 start_codon:yes stop_codon:yes gene_type:complete